MSPCLRGESSSFPSGIPRRGNAGRRDAGTIRDALVTGISWAKQANLILFYNAPDRGVHVWTPEGKQIAFLADLKGECWRQTQLSADGNQILYLSSNQACAFGNGHEVRVFAAFE